VEIGYVEARAAVARRMSGRIAADARRELEDRWDSLDGIAVDRTLIELGGWMADTHRLRALDALHLAAACRVAGSGLVFASWDQELRRAASDEGLALAPA
jgi:predicted nucleic acid-binding protein